jgi:hypothetical protein
VKVLTFVAGLGAGYVLGTRAGREKYDQMVQAARNLSNQPAVTQARNKIRDLTGVGIQEISSATTVEPRTGGATAASGAARKAPKKATAAGARDTPAAPA